MKAALLVFGVIFVLASPILLVAHPAILEWSYPRLEKHLSGDNVIAPESRERLADVSYFCFMIIPLAVGVLLLASLNDSVRGALKPSLLPLLLGILLTIPALPRVMSVGIPAPLRFLYREDGPLEVLTVLAFLVSSFFFGRAAWLMTRRSQSQDKGHTKRAVWICIFFMLVSFLVAMEEMSWGQRLLGLETPQSVARLNYQDEITLHNLIHHRSFVAAYRILTVLPIATLVGVWLRTSKRILGSFSCILPYPEMIGLTFLIGFLAIQPPPELLEELVSLLVLLYSFLVLRCVAREVRGQ